MINLAVKCSVSLSEASHILSSLAGPPPGPVKAVTRGITRACAWAAWLCGTGTEPVRESRAGCKQWETPAVLVAAARGILIITQEESRSTAGPRQGEEC